MKIKKVEINNKNKLIELQIIKSKLYKKSILGIEKIKISKTKLYLKKIIYVIYEYHINNKNILFINFPINIQKNIYKTIKKTHQHIFIDEKNFTPNFIRNHSKNYFDLIIQFSPNKTNYNQFLNIYDIPKITIHENAINPILTLNYTYKILGNLRFVEKQINNNFFFSILHSIFKQTTLKRKQIFYKKKLKSIIKPRNFRHS